MSTGAARYAAYRDSGLPWLGEIPAHWEVNRAKVYLREVDDRSVDGSEERLSVSHLTGVTPRREKNVTMFEAESYVGHKVCRPGDVVVNTMWAWMGALGVARHHGIVSPSYAVYGLQDPEAFDTRYLDFLLRIPLLVAEYRRSSTGIQESRLRLYPERFLTVSLPYPPREEQGQIANYLDALNRLRMRYKRARRRMIAYLDEQRRAIVYRAVTGAAESASERRSVDLPWVKDVPAHWQDRHLGSETDIINGFPFDSALFSTQAGHPLVRIRDIRSDTTTLCYAGDDIPAARIDHGDLLVGMDGDFNVALWAGGSALLNQRVCCVRPRARIRRDYLALVLPVVLEWINAVTFSTTVKHLSSSDIRRQRIPMPDLAEQDAIVAQVRRSTASLTATAKRMVREMELVEELHGRVVSAIVTGQLDARAIPVSLDAGATLHVGDDLMDLQDDLSEAEEEADETLASVTDDAD